MRPASFRRQNKLPLDEKSTLFLSVGIEVLTHQELICTGFSTLSILPHEYTFLQSREL